jgi:hypothetical protein
MDRDRDDVPTADKLCFRCQGTVEPEWELCDRCLHEVVMRRLGHLAAAVAIEEAAERAAREEGRNS